MNNARKIDPEKVRKAMQTKGVHLTEIALELGWIVGTVRKVLEGKFQPTSDEVAELARLLGVAVDELYE